MIFASESSFLLIHSKYSAIVLINATNPLFIHFSEIIDVDVCVHALQRQCDELMRDDVIERWTRMSALVHCSCEHDAGTTEDVAEIYINGFPIFE